MSSDAKKQLSKIERDSVVYVCNTPSHIYDAGTIIVGVTEEYPRNSCSITVMIEDKSVTLTKNDTEAFIQTLVGLLPQLDEANKAYALIEESDKTED